MNQLAYLEFLSIDDYVAYLKDFQSCPVTRLEFTNTMGQVAHGICDVTYYAVATARIDLDNTIAVCGIVLMHTDTANLEMDKHREPADQTRTKLQARFDKIAAEFLERDVTVNPGKWLIEAPEYLK